MGNIFDDIKKLREATGAGMGDCKLAIEEAQGDFEAAIEILRKKGIMKAAKRADREAAEGIVKLEVSGDGKAGWIVEINAETDFVVRNELFRNFTDKILAILKERKPGSLDELLALSSEKGSVREELDNLSGTLGEKIGIKRCDRIESEGTVAGYSHMGGKIGVLAALDRSGRDELALDIAMQIAAANPKYISPDDVPAQEIEKEKEIYREQMKKEGKKDEIIEKIISGKINKYFEAVCLLKQEFIKDDKKTVEQILGDVKVEKFVRYSLNS